MVIHLMLQQLHHAVVTAKTTDDLHQANRRKHSHVGQDVDAAGAQLVTAHPCYLYPRHLALQLAHQEAAMEISRRLTCHKQNPPPSQINHGTELSTEHKDADPANSVREPGSHCPPEAAPSSPPGDNGGAGVDHP